MTYKRVDWLLISDPKPYPKFKTRRREAYMLKNQIIIPLLWYVLLALAIQFIHNSVSYHNMRLVYTGWIKKRYISYNLAFYQPTTTFYTLLWSPFDALQNKI